MANTNAPCFISAMAAPVFETIATITAKGQTTVPKPVRDALRVGAGDRIAFRVDDAGTVSVTRVEDDDDPVMESFLTFLAQDMQRRPDAIQALTPSLRQRIAELVEGVDFDLNQTLEGETAL